jgi:hypothetical protein
MGPQHHNLGSDFEKERPSFRQSPSVINERPSSPQHRADAGEPALRRQDPFRRPLSVAGGERCGSSDGIVAEGSFNFGHSGLMPLFSVIQMSIAINHRTSWSAEGKCFGASRLPSADVRSISASLTRRTRPRRTCRICVTQRSW